MTTTKQRPTHRAYVVETYGDDKVASTEIAPVFKSKKGNPTIHLPTWFDGRGQCLVLKKIDWDTTDQDEKGFA